ncbi:hypothetical protein [Streptomyces sp. NPDC058674]|uniref:hypothetical protein n=1 Tax=Streptomyces sp. NPDC058674 TaxID=3346592 RepID=UPI00365A14F8
MNSEHFGWKPLSRRDISTRDVTLLEGVSDHLLLPLKTWLADYLRDSSEVMGRVALQLHVALDTPDPEKLVETISVKERSHLLDAVDAALHLDKGLWWELDVTGPERAMEAGLAPWIPDYRWPKGSKVAAVERLDDMLADAGSAFEVDWRQRCLRRRVDATVTAAVEQAISMDAGRHLEAAWAATYGRHPDPSKAYDEAVRAVEAAAIPVVLPKSTQDSLGKVLAHLRDAASKWELAIEGRNGGDVTPVREMISLLWKGHVARHPGSPGFRRQRQDEAQMAVHLAASLVHWFTTGAIRRRDVG